MPSPPSTTLPRFAFLTPRTLPPADKLAGRVAVLDVAPEVGVGMQLSAFGTSHTVRPPGTLREQKELRQSLSDRQYW